MSAVSHRAVARLSSPGDIVAAIPLLCGFPPHESVVLLSLRGPRKRVGLTVRLDLPEPQADAEAAELLVERVVADGAAAVVVAVFGRERRDALVDAVGEALSQHGVSLTEALHVDDGRWSSYVCTGDCCPVEGTPVPAAPGLLEAQRVLSGRSVLPSREDLVASLAPPLLLARAAAQQEIARAVAERRAEVLAEGVEAWRQAALEQARQALQVVAAGGGVEPALAARLSVALHDVLVRDEVATWALTESDALLALATELARSVPPPDDAPVCVLLAWVAYERGDGAVANVALDRALGSDPDHLLGGLLRTALDSGVSPREVRTLLRETRRRLRS